MVFDLATARHHETVFTFEDGPHQRDDGSLYFWVSATVTFETSEKLVPNIRFMLPVAWENGKTLESVREEAFAAARTLLSHADLPTALSAERREPPAQWPLEGLAQELGLAEPKAAP